MDQLLSTFGALCVLGAYAGNTLKKLDAEALPYVLLNLVGGSLLAWSALKSGSAGLILIEVAWTVISVFALGKWLRGRHQT